MNNQKIVALFVSAVLVVVLGLNATNIVQAATRMLQAKTSQREVWRVQDHSSSCGWVAPGNSCTMTWGQGYSNAEYPTARCVVKNEWNNGIKKSDIKLGAKLNEEYLMLTAFRYEATCTNDSNLWVEMDIKATTVLR